MVPDSGGERVPSSDTTVVACRGTQAYPTALAWLRELVHLELVDLSQLVLAKWLTDSKSVPPGSCSVKVRKGQKAQRPIRERRGNYLVRTAKQFMSGTFSTSNRAEGLSLVAALVLPVCNMIALDVPAGNVLLLEAPAWAYWRGGCGTLVWASMAWGVEEREKRRFIMFFIPDSSAWRVVVAEQLLRPVENMDQTVKGWATKERIVVSTWCWHNSSPVGKEAIQTSESLHRISVFDDHP
ncbi:hypothetical protein DFJ58DRAFT_840877 [Suillus subalutaceus]|uniref:uncharacterized protein n=1 Tax=Suillus subalutaceus TaxID=48586 RepID=UPI001B87C64B|nr:uncharacterized protein DFJ58DRAFT_840877 [Suillus subalutaceus]KAG1856361.1 hypothetical protein DFJ58DRAFT_840877 [Suillus subalutaceus]